MHPYEQFPFQYSCHILQEDGTLTHAEYLHADQTDPRQPLAEQLVTDIPDTGSVLAYNAGFEKRVLNSLQERFPALQASLQGIIHRLWDQLDIFRTYYTDYRFQGSNSIKSVVPVLIPDLSYDDLDIASGDVAQVIWNDMLQTTDARTKQKYAAQLRAYCRQDTLAMVRIHEYLIEVLKT
jgi:hypothetical protein